MLSQKAPWERAMHQLVTGHRVASAIRGFQCAALQLEIGKLGLCLHTRSSRLIFKERKNYLAQMAEKAQAAKELERAKLVAERHAREAELKADRDRAIREARQAVEADKVCTSPSFYHSILLQPRWRFAQLKGAPYGGVPVPSSFTLCHNRLKISSAVTRHIDNGWSESKKGGRRCKRRWPKKRRFINWKRQHIFKQLRYSVFF